MPIEMLSKCECPVDIIAYMYDYDITMIILNA